MKINRNKNVLRSPNDDMIVHVILCEAKIVSYIRGKGERANKLFLF